MKPMEDKKVYYHYAFDEILSDIVCEIRDNLPTFIEQDVLRDEEMDYDRETNYIKGYSQLSYRFPLSDYEIVKEAFLTSISRNKDNIIDCKAHIIGVNSEEAEAKYFKKYSDGYELDFGLEIHRGDKDKMIREKISDVERQVQMDPIDIYRKERLEEKKYGRRHY